jgi:hypothetical protein
MRKHLKYLTLMLMLNCVSFLAFGQFEGTITYNIEYSSSDESMQQYLGSFPKQSTLKIKNEYMRLDQSVAGGATQSLISNASDTSTTLILNIMGNAYQVNLSLDEVMQLEQAEAFKIVEAEETKMIAGYLCKKAFAISGTDSLTIYYTEEIKSQNIVPQFSKLTGFPLEYEMEKGNVRMKYTCSNISQEEVDMSSFLVSSSIREIPFDDFARSFAIPKD